MHRDHDIMNSNPPCIVEYIVDGLPKVRKVKESARLAGHKVGPEEVKLGGAHRRKDQSGPGGEEEDTQGMNSLDASSSPRQLGTD